MTDTTAKIRAKGLEATGITEEIANTLFNQVGKYYMGIIEFKVEEPHGPNAEGKRRVDLVLTQVEPSMDPTLTDHLRQLTRTLHQNRVLHSEDQTLDIDTGEDLEPSVTDVIAAQRAHDAGQPHPFASDQNTDGTPRCELCGEAEDDQLHVELADPDDNDSDAVDQDEPPAPDDPAFESHPFTGTDGYVCELCDQPEDAAVHATADEAADDPVPVA